MEFLIFLALVGAVLGAIAFYRCLERGIPPSEGMLTQSVNGIFQPAF